MWFRFVEAEYNGTPMMVMISNQSHKQGDWVTDGRQVWCTEAELGNNPNIAVVIGQSQPVLAAPTRPFLAQNISQLHSLTTLPPPDF